jgi:hypothetical protein
MSTLSSTPIAGCWARSFSYSRDEVAILFDYFTRAAPAFMEASTEIRRQAAAHRRRAGRRDN